MNFELLDQAKEVIPNIPVLVNLCSLRVRQLANGMNPMVRPEPGDELVDTVFREIIAGLLTVEVDKEALERRTQSR